jgi:hypothetical protein
MSRNPGAIETIDLPEIESWDDVPQFSSEAEEAEFWSTHGLGEGLLRTLQDDSDARRRQDRGDGVVVRLDDDTVARLKILAKKKHKGYQTLLKEFVMERLYEEEKREGLIA